MGTIRDAAMGLFLEEAAEHLCALEAGLIRLEKDPEHGTDTVEALFRAAHTLKGSAALMKLTSVSTLAHRVEDVLEGLRDRSVLPGREEIDALLFALDRLRELLHRRAEGEESAPLLAQALARLDAASPSPLQGGPPPEPSPSPAPKPSPPRPYAGPERRTGGREETSGAIRVAAEKIEGIMNVLGQLAVAQTHLVNELSTVDGLRREIGFAGERLLREVGRFADRYAYGVPRQERASDHLLLDFNDLEFDRYDEINLFARKLQEITSDIGEALRVLGDFFGDFQGEVEGMDRLTREMKERLSEVRTVQAGVLFQRFTRTVRDLSRQCGRPLELIVSGSETPIDRTLFDGLYEPLLHLVRNAAAHGIEPEEERVRLGKPAGGRLWLCARRKGNTVAIELRDDGRGIQFDRVARRAVEKGLLPPEANPSERDLLQLILRPGFSTSDTADGTSGRGVGMNVVVDRLSALNGTLEIESRPGEGTTMRLTVPLSLVIVNVIQFRLGGQNFVIPSNLVTEITDLPALTETPATLDLRGEEVPAVDLRRLFGLPPAETPPRFAIFSRPAGNPVALLVDAIVRQEDAVIRPFDTLLREMPHLAGTSLAGDGTLRLVFNPARVLEPRADATPAPVFTPPPPRPSEEITVLVVDDSLSVRRYASLALEAGGMRVLTATQGMEALDVLDREPVDFVLSDLEMPVMHGYELLRELGRRGRLSTLPVAILSSRAGAAHREKAMELGACDYLVKPFEEEELVETVRRHTAR